MDETSQSISKQTLAPPPRAGGEQGQAPETLPRAGAMAGRLEALLIAASRPAVVVALLMLIALAHGLVYALGVPLWQAPDEPMLYEYAALAAELGRIPAKADRSLALERRLLASMEANGFWRFRRGPVPDPPPTDLVALREQIYMPRQVGGDPPVYFALAAIPLRLTAGWSVEAQVYLLRVLGALLLPLSVACVYWTAHALVTLPESSASLWCYIPTAAAALVALQPMYVYVGSMLSNDGPANALAAVLCLLIVRAIGRGVPGRDLVLILVVAAVAMQTKRTTVPYGLIAGILAAIWLARLALRGGPGATRRRVLAIGLAVGLPVATAVGVAGQLDWGLAARWYDARTLAPAVRVAAGEGYALALDSGEEAIQVLPDVAIVRLRNSAVRAGARVWGDGPATGRLVIYTGHRRQEYAFAIERMSLAELSAAVPTTAQDVRIGIVADSGRLYASDIWMEGVGLPGPLLTNGDLARPALRPGSALQAATSYLRFEEFLWVMQSGRPAWGLDLGQWWRWLFVSFWGHFGWMDVPFVRDSLWEPALAAMAALGLIGACLALITGRQVRRGLALALFGLLGIAMLPLLVNALIDPLPIQQGRYLFPVLPALAILMALGQAALVPRRARGLWMACWLGFWLACAGAALLTLTRFYYG